MNKELKIGLFAVLILVISFFLINFLRGEDILNREIDVQASFADVQGLVPSAPVFVKGYKAGKVSEVSYDSESCCFNVICSVSKQFAVPVDSKLTIFSTDIMGSKGVRIDLGHSSEYVADGDSLTPAFEAGMMDALAVEISPLMAKLNSTLDSLSVTVAGVNRLLSDSNQTSISRTLAHLENTLYNVSSLSRTVNGKSAEIETFISELTSLSGKLDKIVENAASALDGADKFMTTLNESDIQGLVDSFRKVLVSLHDPEGTIGKLFVDSSVYDSVDSLLSDVDSLVNKIQENPKKYLKISVF